MEMNVQESCTNEEMHLIIHEKGEQKENVLLRELFTKRTLC